MITQEDYLNEDGYVECLQNVMILIFKKKLLYHIHAQFLVGIEIISKTALLLCLRIRTG